MVDGLWGGLCRRSLGGRRKGGGLRLWCSGGWEKQGLVLRDVRFLVF